MLAIEPERLAEFEALCLRERCPYAVVGEATEAQHLRVDDAHFGDAPIDLPMGLLLGKTPRMHRNGQRLSVKTVPFQTAGLDLEEAVSRVLRIPTVASKSFLITIGDRSITGMVAQDQMVGPWQVPVADVAVTTASFDTDAGEAMAMGERTPLALLNAPAAGRMAIAEAITNLMAADVSDISDIKLSANWMVSAGDPGEDARLYDTVRAVGMELCPALGINIPVGKDSMSMRASWEDEFGTKRISSPLSLIVTAFAPVRDARRTATPQIRLDQGASEVWLIDLGAGRNRLGGSALAHAYGHIGSIAPDLDEPGRLKGLFRAVRRLSREGRLLAMHDRSDGGLIVTLLEMAFAGHAGLNISVPPTTDPLGGLFSEELGMVLQVRSRDVEAMRHVLQVEGLAAMSHRLGTPTGDQQIRIDLGDGRILGRSRVHWHRIWAETSARIQALRDHPDCAKEEFDGLLDLEDPGINPQLTFDPRKTSQHLMWEPVRVRGGHSSRARCEWPIEMAAGFDRAGLRP